MHKKSAIKEIGRQCANFRREHGYTLFDIAYNLGYKDISGISRFEHGQNDSAYILLWYLLHGMQLERSDNYYGNAAETND